LMGDQPTSTRMSDAAARLKQINATSTRWTTSSTAGAGAGQSATQLVEACVWDSVAVIYVRS
jgi:hypothetical protein